MDDIAKFTAASGGPCERLAKIKVAEVGCVESADSHGMFRKPTTLQLKSYIIIQTFGRRNTPLVAFYQPIQRLWLQKNHKS